MRPIKFVVYKKSSAMQFALVPANFVCSENRRHRVKQVEGEACTEQGCSGKAVSQEGVIFVDIAPATGPQQYDWSKKIVFALSHGNVAELLHAMRYGVEAKLVHDPGAKSEKAGQVVKSFNMTFPKKPQEGCMVHVNQSDKAGEKKNYSIGFSGSEIIALSTLFLSALPKMLAWE